MSRVGKHPIVIPAGVTLTEVAGLVAVSGPKGKMEMRLHDQVELKIENGQVVVSPKRESKTARAMWGTTRRNLFNMVHGVVQGFTEKLEFTGVGFRAAVNSQGQLRLSLGFSHDIVYIPQPGISIHVPKAGEIEVSGIDKQQVGQVAAEIRGFKKPEPYKGKGIRYAGEVIRRKEGKKK